MKFGKTLQQQIFAQNGFPGWSSFFCDYKGLKKIINSLAKGRPADAALLAAGVRPPRPDAAEQLPAHKAAFFFKLERELEKINDFYYQRESALKVRLRTLIDKRKLLTASLSEPNGKVKALSRDSSSFGALYEGFRNFERDLGRLQTYIELNATAFRKICKKWDKACRRQADRFGDTRPQEGQPDGQLYLARQVEVQPVFNREFIAQLSDVASANLLSLENLLGGDGQRTGSAALADGSSIDGTTHSAPHLPTLFDRADRAEALEDLETALVSAVKARDQAIVDEVLGLLLPSTRAEGEPKGPVARILWRAALEEADAEPRQQPMQQDGVEPHPEQQHQQQQQSATPAIPQGLLDFAFVDDINGRTTLHESASAGRLALVVACLEHGLSVAQADVYGRQPLHYAAMNGHAAVCRTLLDAGASPSTADLDGYSPIIYSITNGWTSVVETFLAAGVSFDEPAEAPGSSSSSSSSADQLNALSLASQYGHEAIARLLLERGAKVLPNPAGYWPQHLAAREGHAGVLGLLVEAIQAEAAASAAAAVEGGIDAPDKYSQATPLCHAASEGHAESVRVLLAAGADVHAVDEFKRTPVHYAAWQGHIECVNLLIDAGATIPPQPAAAAAAADEAAHATASGSTTDMAPPDLDDLDVDAIPDLSLPPPIIPFRVYGHSYIDEKRLVQITLGHPNTARAPFPPPIRLYDQPNHGHAPSLKLVITPKPDSSGTSIPHSVILPLADEREVFSFQVDTLADISLEFDLFPTFGSKMIGKAVAVPSTFADLKSQGSYVVPIVDPHLKVIGDIPFEINVVKPFGRAQLQIGGQFETYWKSTATLQTSAAQGDHNGGGGGGGGGGSNNPATSSVVTASSLSGEHVRIVVQVTADGHPVAYPLWRLPVDGFDVSVGDVRLDQFSALAKRLGKSVDPAQVGDREDPSAWYQAIADALVPLEELLSILPASLGVNLELRYPTRSDVRRLSLSRTLEVNDFVDCVLSTVYKSIKSSHPSSPSSPTGNGPDSTPAHRRIVLSSFNPVVCTALNWKQPNFSVFFASYCGLSRSAGGMGDTIPVEGQPSKLVPANRVEDDRRCTSIREAVKFAKANNLLGIMLEATMLVQIPSLIQSAREHGLLITTFGTASRVVLADAHMTDGVLSYATSDFLAQTAAS
ncbi:uncharacterized protein RHOBADRAFT_48327 [Rhodotorula graminis WP1]|uniref:Cyclin-dependent protein kinase inhibitor n=1 Tax=Rhodotorula graminis (strain WP1) TaxID=578459 RepID=A0A194S5L8_RHOGW|nr:uncharacterized protein RHOBADRAFT_48327 [Rhodotorula graminis WP1]KPV75877.1 hypothetical protein RHOBADRAFT_48327 [Rhodotorula graminis WP1]